MPDRKVVLYTRDETIQSTKFLTVVHSTDDIIDLAMDTKTHFLIGGAHMFRAFGHLCQYFYVTRVLEDENHTFEGDVFFPDNILGRYFELYQEKPHTDFASGTKLKFQMYVSTRKM